MGIDPLTVEWWHDLQEYGWGCDCPASGDPMMLHAETCSVTPTYAQLCIDSPSTPRDVYWDIAGGNMSLFQTVIKCAQCGREMLGRDALVIYEAPLAYVPGDEHTYKYPKNIVKAVCPHHNRVSRPGYMSQSWAGY